MDPTDAASRLAVAYALRALCTRRQRQGEYEQAVACAERIFAVYADDQSPDAFRLRADALGYLLLFSHEQGDPGRQADATRRAWQLIGEVAALVTEAGGQAANQPSPPDYRWAAKVICHNLGCVLLWTGRPADAASLFERALAQREDALTRFFYAGALLQARGDREGALANLRRAASDPRTSLIHRFERAFRENTSLAPVHDDPEFLAVAREAEQRYAALAGG